MNNKIQLLLTFCVFMVLSACSSQEGNNEISDASLVIACNQNLTDALVERHFTPPVAARNYAYPNIAAYIALQPFHPDYLSLEGQLNDLDFTPVPEEETYDEDLVLFNTFTKVALKLVFNDTLVENYRIAELNKYKEAIRSDIYERSIAYSDEVADKVLAWADKDMYKETRNFGEFATADDQGKWKPTSPGYAPGIEPHWNKIRPFVMDSSNQFEPERPTAFDVQEGSKFYEETMQVYNTVNDINGEQKEIAQFWDCNPNISHTHGHFMYFLQKISPGGHWVHIALQVLEAEKQTRMQGVTTMALLGMTLHDAFIACWTEKYKSNYIRPETVIKERIDKNWDPILQTPAFPEYPSGHSVASASAATVLTHHIGPNYAFIDSSETPYGLGKRSFSSFREASDEAAISRLYGGIHYMPAISNGIQMGNQVGELVVSRVKFKKQ